MKKISLPSLKNESLFQQALTHRSYANENPRTTEDNERLEFLGDAVLGFLVGELLYKNYSQLNEAQLTRLRSHLVEEKQLANIASQLGVGELMKLGKGAIKEGAKENPSLLSDTFEALIGAYYLDSSITEVKAFVKKIFNPIAQKMVLSLNEDQARKLVDSKSLFQQWTLNTLGQTPEYIIIAESGPDHAKEFTAQVQVNQQVYGSGIGRRKQEAEKQAAENALKNQGLI